MTTLTDTQVITASGGLVELGYGAYSSGNIVISSTSPTSPNTVIPALSVVCDGSPVAVEFFAPQVIVGGGAAGSAVYVSLWRDGSEIRRFWGVGGDTVGTLPMRLDYRDVPSAGAHTYSVTAYKAVGNDTTFATGSTATAQAPAFLRVSKIVQATQWPAVTTGTIICTSSTRPASPFVGQSIYETDTLTTQLWNGTYWSQVWPQQFVTASDTTTQTGGASADFVYSTATITLTPGTWLVQGSASIINTATNDASSVGLYNATASSEVTLSRGPASTVGTTASAQLTSRLVAMTVSASTNVRVLCTRNGFSTIRAQASSGAPAASLWAQKVG